MIQLTDAFSLLFKYTWTNNFWLQYAANPVIRDPINRRAVYFSLTSNATDMKLASKCSSFLLSLALHIQRTRVDSLSINQGNKKMSHHRLGPSQIFTKDWQQFFSPSLLFKFERELTQLKMQLLHMSKSVTVKVFGFCSGD